MSINLSLFFKSGTNLIAIPSKEKPRLIFPEATPFQQWLDCSQCPTFTENKRPKRLLLRFKAALGRDKLRVGDTKGYLLDNFIGEKLSQVSRGLVLVGTPGPAQKITVQLRDSSENIIGYLKYSDKPAAMQRLAQEFNVLLKLPAGLGPLPLRFGSLGSGEALLLSPLPGKKMPSFLPPPSELSIVLRAMLLSTQYSIYDHPWIQTLSEKSDLGFDMWLKPLAGRRWPTVILHGDFAPWNILQDMNRLNLLDWEYGSLEGFPYMDLVYFMLQVAALVYSWKPSEAFRYIEIYLSRELQGFLDAFEIRSLIRLSAYSAYLQALQDGHKPDAPIQNWRRAVWEVN